MNKRFYDNITLQLDAISDRLFERIVILASELVSMNQYTDVGHGMRIKNLSFLMCHGRAVFHFTELGEDDDGELYESYITSGCHELQADYQLESQLALNELCLILNAFDHDFHLAGRPVKIFVNEKDEVAVQYEW